MNNINHNKVVIIGLDGATFSLIMPWIKDGKLPVLSKLIQEGAWGNLKSTIPFDSPVAWSSFATGKNPGKHGVFGFQCRAKDSYDIKFINSFCRKGKSLWKLLSEMGKKVVVLNVPVTYPPEEVNGCLISGLPASEVNEKIFYPPKLFKEIISRVGMFRIKPFPRDYIRLNRLDMIFEEMDSVVDQHFKVGNYLIQNKAWDFFCMAITVTDNIQHFFWHHMDPNHPFHDPSQGALYGECILKICEKIDGMIGALIDKLDDNSTVFVLSDHGAGASGNRVLYLNNWLAHEGLLSYKGASNTVTTRSGFTKNSIFLAKKYIPRKYKNKIRRLFPWLKSKVETLYWDPRIDWSRTKAFSYDTHGLIWINLKDRELGGIVAEGKEYENLRNKIIERAANFTDPETGEKIFSEALRKEEIYYGEEMVHAPDIILIQKEMQYTYPYGYSRLSRNNLPIETVTLEETRNNPVQTASHQRNGIMIIKGSSVQCGKNVTNARIIDIAPTVLYLMGAPIPEDMDGSVITEAINPHYLNSNPLTYSKAEKADVQLSPQTDYTSEKEKKVEETLKSLGYIE